MTKQQEALQAAMRFLRSLPFHDHGLYSNSYKEKILRACYENITMQGLNIEDVSIITKALEKQGYNFQDQGPLVYDTVKLVLQQLGLKNKSLDQ